MPNPCMYNTSFPGSAPVAASISDLAGSALNSIKTGFLSCVRHVSNSVVSMKNAVIRGFERMVGGSGVDHQQPVVSQSPEIAVDTTINPISAEATKEVCQALRRKMRENPDYISKMFRVASERTPAEFNQTLADPKQLIAAIEAETYTGVDMGYLIKQWCRDSILGNAFTMDEAIKMVDCKDSYSMNDIWRNKFYPSEFADMENKLFEMLSVPKTYLNIIEQKGKNIPETDRTVVNILSPSLFDIKYESFEQAHHDVSLAEQALHNLLTHLPRLGVIKVDKGTQTNEPVSAGDDPDLGYETVPAKRDPNSPLPAKPLQEPLGVNVNDFVNNLKVGTQQSEPIYATPLPKHLRGLNSVFTENK